MADDFFIISSGNADVWFRGPDGETRKVNSLGPGDYFGEIGLLEGIPRTATVRTTGAAVIYRLGGADFLAIINQQPAVSGTLLDGVVSRLARTDPGVVEAARRAPHS